MYGLKSGVDNAAHVGGLVSGFIIGYLYVYGIKKEKLGTTLKWMVPVVIIITVAGAYAYLEQNKVSGSERATTLSALKGASYRDNQRTIRNQNKRNSHAAMEKGGRDYCSFKWI